MLGDAPQDPTDLTDRSVHELERAEGRAVLGSERMGGDVVVEVVHVDDGNTVVQIARDLRREELAHPHRDADLDLRPLPASARAVRMRQATHQERQQHTYGLANALQRDPAEHDESGQHADDTRAARPCQLGEAEEVVLGAAGEHASVDAAAAKDADAALDVRRLDAGRMPGTREVDVRAAALVVVVEPRDIGLHPVHRGHLKRRRRGRHADAHRMKAVSTLGEHLRDEGHVFFRERAIEHGTREAVDLHDDQPPPDSLRAAAATESADQAIEGALYEQKQVVQRSAPSSARPVAASRNRLAHRCARQDRA